MPSSDLTLWADAGLEPSSEAMRDHLLLGLLQDGSPIPEDQLDRLRDCGVTLQGNQFGLIVLQVVAVDAYAYIRGLGHTSYSEAQLAVNILELLREELGSREGMIAFCKGIQAAAPVDSYVTPEPAPMPGYDSDVIMAAGAFVQGSSIELSADGPTRPPYAVYFQGGLTWYHAKLGILLSLQKML